MRSVIRTPVQRDVADHPCMQVWVAMYECRGSFRMSSMLTCFSTSLRSSRSVIVSPSHPLSRAWTHCADSSSVGGRPFVQWNSEMSASV